MSWVLCPDGCGLHHKPGDEDPVHDPKWLVAERKRLLQENAKLQDIVDLVIAKADRIDLLLQIALL